MSELGILAIQNSKTLKIVSIATKKDGAKVMNILRCKIYGMTTMVLVFSNKKTCLSATAKAVIV